MFKKQYLLNKQMRENMHIFKAVWTISELLAACKHLLNSYLSIWRGICYYHDWFKAVQIHEALCICVMQQSPSPVIGLCLSLTPLYDLVLQSCLTTGHQLQGARKGFMLHCLHPLGQWGDSVPGIHRYRLLYNYGTCIYFLLLNRNRIKIFIKGG